MAILKIINKEPEVKASLWQRLEAKDWQRARKVFEKFNKQNKRTKK